MYKKFKEVKVKERCASVSYHKAKDQFAVSSGNSIRLYNTSALAESSPDCKQKIELSNDIISMKYSNDGSFLATSDLDYKISVLDAENFYNDFFTSNKEVLKTWKMDFSPNSKDIATGAYNLVVYDIKKRDKVCEIYNDNNFIYCLCFIDETRVAVGNANGSICVYDLSRNKLVARLEDHCLRIRSLKYDFSNKLLFSASDDLHINIIDPNTFKVIQPVVGHKDCITNLSFSGNVFASCSFDSTIKFWDLRNSSNFNLSTIEASESGIIWDSEFSQDGKYFLAGSENGFIVVDRT